MFRNYIISNFFSGAPQTRTQISQRKGFAPAPSGLAANTAGEEPQQNPARNWAETKKIIACDSKKKLRRVAHLIFIVFFITLLVPSQIYAQRISGIGIKGGLNIANILSPEPAEKWNNRMGLAAGGFFAIRINDVLTIQTELLISEKGAKWAGLFEGKDIEVTANITYLDIPVLWKFYIPSLSKSPVRPNLFWGPCWSIKLIGTRSIKSGEVIQEDDIQDLNDRDFSLLFGGGIDFDVQTGKIFFDIRYGLSYSKIFRTGKDKNRVISFSISYSFF